MTNYERIKSMTKAELAEFIHVNMNCVWCICSITDECKRSRGRCAKYYDQLQWLDMEANDDKP